MSATESKSETIISLTEDQEKFLADCETAFKDRYTETDADFMSVKDIVSNVPPVIDPWYNKPRRNFDWADRRSVVDGSGDAGRGPNERWQNNRQGGGGGYRQHRQNQGNNHQGGYQAHRQGDRFHQQRYRPY